MQKNIDIFIIFLYLCKMYALYYEYKTLMSDAGFKQLIRRDLC